MQTLGTRVNVKRVAVSANVILISFAKISDLIQNAITTLTKEIAKLMKMFDGFAKRLVELAYLTIVKSVKSKAVC